MAGAGGSLVDSDYYNQTSTHFSTSMDIIAPPNSVYRLMPSSSPRFVGCEDYLQKLDEFFHVRAANDMSCRVFVLFGVGGGGKTQICLKFAEQSSDR
jgi:hypothetical protein